MKRIVTGFLLAFFAIGAQAQMPITHSVQKQVNQAPPVTIQAQSASGAIGSLSNSKNEESTLSPEAFKTEGVSYLQDTTNGNWWIYTPVLSTPADSFEYFRGGSALYLQIEDTIGPLDFSYGNSLGQLIDTTAFDTMYYRIMGLRVTPPTDLGAGVIHLDSANITFFPEALDPADEIQVWAVQVEDAGQSNLPFPAIVSATPIAKATIKASDVTLQQVNSLTVSFAGKSLTSPSEKNQIAIVAFVDGPNFPSDTVGYLLEADVQQQLGASLVIDTDGQSMQLFGPDSTIPMRTYLLNLDAGNIVVNGVASQIGGGGRFFIDFTQVDQTGTPTGDAFEGNLAITTYFHGTALAGVSPNATDGYGLGENYPNPVSTTTDINYNLGQSGPVTLNVYNVLGQNVGTLVNSTQGMGQHTVTFNAGTLPDGMYYYKLQSGEFSATNSMVIAR
jgi:Secretion system C-terminal sorting domain